MENPTKKAPKLSSIEEFKKFREKLVDGITVELPDSKLTIKVSRPDLESLIMQGKVSKSLIDTAMRKSLNQLTVDDLKTTIELRDFIVSQAIVYPKIVDKDPKKDEVTLDCFSRTDKDFVYNYVEKGDEVLKFFRRK